MVQQHEDQNISVSFHTIRKILRGVAGIFLVVSTGLGIWTAYLAAHHPKTWDELAPISLEYATSICAHLGTASVLFLVTDFAFLTKLDEAKRNAWEQRILGAVVGAIRGELDTLARLGIKEHKNVTKVPWDAEIDRAQNIELLVQGWMSWTQEHRDALQRFFKRGGVFTLFLPDPEDSTMTQQIAHRLRRLASHQKMDITETRQNLQDYCAGTQGQLHIFIVTQVMWYCAVSFDERKLFVSLYEHVRGQTIESPTYEIPLKDHKHTQEWIRKEFSGIAASPGGPPI